MDGTQMRRLDASYDSELAEISLNSGLLRREMYAALSEEMFGRNAILGQCIGYFKDKLVGFIYVKKDYFSNNNWNFYALAVDKDYQRQGIGTVMLETSINEIFLHKNGRIITIESSTEFHKAHSLYVRMGFTSLYNFNDYYSDGVHKTIFAIKSDRFLDKKPYLLKEKANSI